MVQTHFSMCIETRLLCQVQGKKERKKACLSYCPDSCSGLEKTQRSLKNDTQWLLITNGRKSDRVIPGFGLVLYYPPTATTCFEVHLTA